MNKRKLTQTTYQLTEKEITIAVTNFVVEQLQLKQPVKDQNIKIDYAIIKDGSLESLSVTFTKTEQTKLNFKLKINE